MLLLVPLWNRDSLFNPKRTSVLIDKLGVIDILYIDVYEDLTQEVSDENALA